MATIAPEPSPWPARVLVTGGAGFVGANVARRLVARGVEVVVLDNLSRAYSRANAAGLARELGDGVRIVAGDIRNEADVRTAMAEVGAVVHLAAQTAVTRSIDDPLGDFVANVGGTINVLEAARRRDVPPTVLYASTNKVYGDLDSLEIIERADSYDFASRPAGIDECEPVHLVTPYACSKGAAEQYVLDYWRTYGVPTVAFRQSCIYGPHQVGAEEQGWIAWFLHATISGTPLAIFGDGKQVRDLLFVDDLFDCYEAAMSAVDVASGEVYNVGGGASNRLSVWWQLAPLLARVLDRPLDTPIFGPWRPGDQRVFYTDTSKAARDLGWAPRVDVETGLRLTLDWYRHLGVEG